MANDLIWNVYNLIRTVPDGVVTKVCCTVSMVDGKYSSSGDVSQKVPYKSPSDPDFIPFDQLTEAEVVQWVQQQLGQNRITQIERGLAQAIAKQKIQTTSGLPW
jgi:hypothetical protein